MITISLCIIVKNEEGVIRRCLESVKGIVDEINIVDTGSTDRTKEIVTQFTDRVFNFTWIDDFSAARNFAFQQATKEYILWLDADDVLLESDQELLLNLKQTLDSSVDAVSMQYNLAFDENQHVTSSLRRYRLVKRERGFKWFGFVHEYLEVGGHLYDSNVSVSHLPLSRDQERNIRIYETMETQGHIFTPRDLFYFANELVDHHRFDKAIEYYTKFIKTEKGWVEDNIQACHKLADCCHHFGLEDQELQWVLHALSYGVPKPETCCRLGFLLMNKQNFHGAIYWYKAALGENGMKTFALQDSSFSTWLPHLQLAVCYDKIGEQKAGYEHNEAARKFRPNDERILANKIYFENALKL